MAHIAAVDLEESGAACLSGELKPRESTTLGKSSLT